MNLVDFYYDFNAGETPENEEYKIKTKKTFDYLLEAGLTEREVVDLIVKDFDNKDFISHEDIPNHLWDNSLLVKDTFYFHKNLQILSPPPTWDKVFPFYREMKIKYTEEDILTYFIKTFKINDEWINVDKELGSIKYLLKKYKQFSFVNPVDFILLLIDYAKSIDKKVYGIYDICDLEMEYAEILEIDIKNAKLNNKNTIVWR